MCENKKWLLKIRACFRDMTEAVTIVADSSFPFASLHRQIPIMHSLQVSLRGSLECTEYLNQCARMDPAYRLFLKDFTALLSALVPQLHRLGTRLDPVTASTLDPKPVTVPDLNRSKWNPAPVPELDPIALFLLDPSAPLTPRSAATRAVTEDTTSSTGVVMEPSAAVELDVPAAAVVPVSSGEGREEEAVFRELWKFLATSFNAFDTTFGMWPACWVVDEQPTFTRLLIALHALLTWLLPMLRNPIWASVIVRHGQQTIHDEMMCVLAQPAKCLAGLSAAPVSTLLEYTTILAPNFTPLLCSIITEVGISLLNAPPYNHSVTEALNNFTMTDKQTGCSGRFAFLKDPAVLKCRKALKIFAVAKSSPAK